jgi:hypothetical protein
MGAITNNNNLSSGTSFKEVVTNFFKVNTPESTKVLFWKVFQCWALKDCNLKAEVSDQEIALFFDQLIDLVAAAYILHQANRVSSAGQQGELET